MLIQLFSQFIAKKPISASQTPEGYFPPLSSDALLDEPKRKRLLQQNWQHCALPIEVYQRFYLSPLKQLVTRVQQVPATYQSDWSQTGGFIDLTLTFIVTAQRLAKGHLLPPQASVEEQAEQGLLWQAVIYWAALCYHLSLLSHLQGELADGTHWQPGIIKPTQPFRFRFIKSPIISADKLANLIAGQLLSTDLLHWFYGQTKALSCLLAMIVHQSPPLPLVATLLTQAAEQVRSPLLFSSVPVSSAMPISPVLSTTNTNSQQSTLEQMKQSEEASQQKTDSTIIQKEDTDVLLTLFSQTTPPPSLDNASEPLPSTTPGEQFFAWLSMGLLSGAIPINQIDSRVHVLGDYLFLCIPAIFFAFLKKHPELGDKDSLQASFEQLHLHHLRRGKCFVQIKRYAHINKTGKFTALTGYLVKGQRIYQDQALPNESEFIVLS